MINRKVILNIAKTHLLTKYKQTIVAALGVTFGIGSYITLSGFMTGLNGMLDDLILNQTPHIHIYNEIQPSEKQPIASFDEFKNTLNRNWLISMQMALRWLVADSLKVRA